MITTPTQEIERWIAEHGNARDALNVALARLAALEAEAGRGREEVLIEIHGEIWNAIDRVRGNAPECIQGLRVASVIVCDLRTAASQTKLTDFGPDDFSSEEEYIAWRKKNAASQPETEAETLTEEQRLEEERLYDDAMIEQRFRHD